VSTEDLIKLGLIAGIGYLIYRAWGAVSAGVAAVTNVPVTAAAQAYVNLTSSPSMVAQGNVVLPDGTSVPISSLSPQPVAGTNSASVSYMGSQYYLNTPSDPTDGNWYAESTLNTDTSS
jgi:hypothetical protein